MLKWNIMLVPKMINRGRQLFYTAKISAVLVIFERFFMKISQIPNFITSLRILGTFVLIFTPYEKLALFLTVYTLTGISDILDGFIARKMGTVSEFGARLDSIADIFFYAVMLLRLMPTLLVKITAFIWCWVALVFALRIASYVVAAVKYHKFATLHTYMNKLTGAAVFTAPYIMHFDFYLTVCALICFVGTISSAEELIIHLISKKYDPNKRTLLHFVKKKTPLVKESEVKS